ncbi:MAG: hypothetical protein ACI3XG_10305 [Faecousia sp.]
MSIAIFEKFSLKKSALLCPCRSLRRPLTYHTGFGMMLKKIQRNGGKGNEDTPPIKGLSDQQHPDCGKGFTESDEWICGSDQEGFAKSLQGIVRLL